MSTPKRQQEKKKKASRKFENDNLAVRISEASSSFLALLVLLTNGKLLFARCEIGCALGEILDFVDGLDYASNGS